MALGRSLQRVADGGRALLRGASFFGPVSRRYSVALTDW